MHAFSMMTWNTAGLQDPKDFYKNVSQHKIVFIQEYGLSELHIIDEDYMGAFIVFLAPMDALRPKRRICTVPFSPKMSKRLLLDTHVPGGLQLNGPHEV